MCFQAARTESPERHRRCRGRAEAPGDHAHGCRRQRRASNVGVRRMPHRAKHGSGSCFANPPDAGRCGAAIGSARCEERSASLARRLASELRSGAAAADRCLGTRPNASAWRTDAGAEGPVAHRGDQGCRRTGGDSRSPDGETSADLVIAIDLSDLPVRNPQSAPTQVRVMFFLQVLARSARIKADGERSPSSVSRGS